jgi:CTP synthase
MHSEDIISNPDLSTVYEIPLVLNDQGLTKRIQEKLHLETRVADTGRWKEFLEKFKKKHTTGVEIGIVGKYFGTGDYQLKDSYAALFDAIDHAAAEVGVDVTTRWIDAERVEKYGAKEIGSPTGIIVPIGWGERGTEGMIQAASYAREQKIPFLGLCYGMQLSVVSFARDIIGWKDAHTTEVNPDTDHPVIHIIEGQKELLKKRAYGGTMRLGGWEAIVKKGTRAYELYDAHAGFISKEKGLTSERHRHRYEFNNAYIEEFEKNGLRISAQSVQEQLVEIVELPKNIHPFYVGTQGHPEYKSRPTSPHPIFLGFMDACKQNA